MSTALLLRLNEIAPEVSALDETGNLEPMTGDPASVPPLELPDVVLSMSGRGRSIEADHGLQAGEAVADSTRLTRDVSVRGFMSYAIGAAGIGDIGTVLCRGRGHALHDDETVLYCVELEKATATTALLRLRWEEIGGGAAGTAGVVFVVPSGFFGFACVRRWHSTTDVDVDYYVNDQLIGSETVATGDIGDGTGGHVLVGCAGDGAGNYTAFLPTASILDQLTVESDALCLEEIRGDHRRLTVHQPAGYRTLRAYRPPGKTWSQDPGSRLQRWLAGLGDSLGLVLAHIERLREDHLPDRAYGEALEHWERLLKLSPMPHDDIPTRRLRVLGFLRVVLGFPVADVKTALEPLFGLTAADIDILEYPALRHDDFSVDDISTLPATPSRIWITEQGDGACSVAIVAGSCDVVVAINTRIDPVYSGGDPPYRETWVSGATGRDVDGAAFVIGIDGPGATDCLYGHMWRDVAGNMIVIGRRQDGAVEKISYFTCVGGVCSGLLDLVVAGGLADPCWLLTRYVGGTTYECGWNATGALDAYAMSGLAAVGPASPRWCGFGVWAWTSAAMAGMHAHFDDAYIHEPNGVRPFSWQAYRDPALPGLYDRTAAQIQLERQKPAHTEAAAVDAMDGIALGPTGTGRLGVDPLFPHDPNVV